MKLEDQIDEMIEDFVGDEQPWLGRSDIRSWFPHEINFNHKSPLFMNIHSLIQEATLTECLTSPSEYIREYRKWWEAKVNTKTDYIP